MTKLSVITAAMNALPALRDTAASLTIQSNRDFEHIIVDGNSGDGTLEWLESQEQARWLSEPDRGIADALNKGFGLATGEFVLVLQAGDTLLSPNSLDEAFEWADAIQPADILAFDIVYGPARRVTQRCPSLRLEWKPLHHQGVLFRKSLFDRIGPFDISYRICMDYDLLLRAKRFGARVRRAPYAIARMDSSGVSSRRDWQSLEARFAEERRVQLANAKLLTRGLHILYWPVYLQYRKLKQALKPS